MDWADSPEQATFRNEVRTFIKERLPQSYRRWDETAEPHESGEGAGWQADRKSSDPKRQERAMQWATALAEKGWIAPHWPKEYGGAGLGTMEQFIFNQEREELQAPSVGGMGVSLIGPTLIVHGNDELKS